MQGLVDHKLDQGHSGSYGNRVFYSFQVFGLENVLLVINLLIRVFGVLWLKSSHLWNLCSTFFSFIGLRKIFHHQINYFWSNSSCCHRSTTLNHQLVLVHIGFCVNWGLDLVGSIWLNSISIIGWKRNISVS